MNSKAPYKKYGFHVKDANYGIMATKSKDGLRITIRNNRVYTTIELSPEDTIDFKNYLNTNQ